MTSQNDFSSDKLGKMLNAVEKASIKFTVGAFFTAVATVLVLTPVLILGYYVAIVYALWVHNVVLIIVMATLIALSAVTKIYQNGIDFTFSALMRLTGTALVIYGLWNHDFLAIIMGIILSFRFLIRLD